MKTVTLKLNRSEAGKMLHPEVCLPKKLDTIRNKEMVTRTFSKLYYKGGGWWLLSGYAQDGHDVDELIVGLL